jgi:hypothetical protein
MYHPDLPDATLQGTQKNRKTAPSSTLLPSESSGRIPGERVFLSSRVYKYLLSPPSTSLFLLLPNTSRLLDIINRRTGGLDISINT